MGIQMRRRCWSRTTAQGTSKAKERMRRRRSRRRRRRMKRKRKRWRRRRRRRRRRGALGRIRRDGGQSVRS